MYSKPIERHRKTVTGIGLCLLAAGLLAACDKSPSSGLADTATFRMERFEEIQRVQDFEDCTQEGLTLDSEARSRASSGAFLNSARVLSRCVEELGPSVDTVPEDKLMQTHALATLNYFKGGDVIGARRSFDQFRTAYPDRDLYLQNNVSFVETGNVLLGRIEDFRLGQFAVLNVDEDLKREMRRINYWKNR